MKLGSICQITIGTANVRESYDFYRELGFRKLAEDSEPYPWIKLTDDSIIILLYQNGDNYMGLTYFHQGMGQVVSNLQGRGVKFVQRGTTENIFITKTDTIVVLVEADTNTMFMAKNKMLLDLPESDFHDASRYPNKWLGIFGEFSHAVDDLQEAIENWQDLGFRVYHQTDSPYPWALMYDGCMIIGLHETKDFEGAALSFFAPDVRNKVEALSALGINAIEYTGHGGDENNVVIYTPEGQKIFLFST